MASSLSTTATALEAIEGAPEGFEALEAPRATSTTIYFGGDVLGNFAAHTAPGTLQFDTPDAILDIIPAIKDREKLKAALSNPMPMNADQLCTPKRTQDCGKIAPEIVGLIYDENNLSAELFIGKDYLEVVDSDSTRYLPLPERNFSSLYNFGGAISGTDADTPNFSLSNHAVFSLGELSLNTETAVSNDGLRFDTAALTAERRGWGATAGLFRSRPGQIMGDRDLAGLSISTSRRTHINARRTDGNDVVLYLARRAYVSIYRDGRLYSSRSYDAGNQVIDTTELPDGAYNITLRIQDLDGSTREEQRFFAKTIELPPANSPIYFLQGGVLREPADKDSTVPELTDAPLVRAGTIRRITDNIGTSFEITTMKDRVIAESSTFMMLETGQLRGTVLGSTRGDYGLQASYIYEQGKFNMAADARKLWAGDQTQTDYDGMLTDATQASLTGSYTVRDNLTVGVRASYYQQGGMNANTTAGPYVEWRIWQEGESMLSLNSSVSRTQDGMEGNGFLQFSRRLGPRYGMTSTGGLSVGGGSPGPTGSARAWYEKRDDEDNFFLAGVGINADGDTQTLSADAQWRNRMGQFNGSVQQALNGSDAGIFYGGSFDINAVQSGGKIKVGGSQSDSAAVLVSVDGDTDSEMFVFVNGMKKGRVKSGHSLPIHLTPFHIYKVRLVSVNKEMIDFDTSDRKVTLYPGNAVRMKWDVNRFYVVVAKIKLPDGTPLANAALQESRVQAATREDGQIQVELSNPKSMLFEHAGGKCRVELPQISSDNGVLIHKEPLVCQPVS